MKKVFFLSIIALSAVMVSCNKTAAPQDSEKEVCEAKASTEVSALRTADALAKYGYEEESASALIEAANILVSTPTQDLVAEEFFAGEKKDDGGKAAAEHLSPAKLIADAKTLTEDKTILAMAAKVEEKIFAEAEGTRGAVGGAKYGRDKVYANDYTYYNVKFWANEMAEVAVSGDGDTDLDLYIYDENGNLITSDTDYTDDCYVRFTPRWTGVFKIKIVNRGRVYNHYVIANN